MKRLECGVLDTSALVCVLYGEPGEKAFLEGFLRCDRLLVCAGTLAEISVVLLYDRDQAGVEPRTPTVANATIPSGHPSETDFHHPASAPSRLKPATTAS